MAGHGPMAAARAPIRLHQSGVLAPNPLSWTFCSPLSKTSTSLRIPVRVRHHNYLAQRITLVRSKFRTGKGSRTALLIFWLLGIWKKTSSEGIGKSTLNFPLLNPMTSTCTHTDWRTQHRSVHITRPFLPSARYKVNLLRWVSLPDNSIHSFLLHLLAPAADKQSSFKESFTIPVPRLGQHTTVQQYGCQYCDPIALH